MTEDQKEEIRAVVRALLVDEVLPQLAIKRAARKTPSRPRGTMEIIGGWSFADDSLGGHG
jgi:hypothetical protein